MLNSFVPSWMQDLFGSASTFHFMDIVNSSLFPLLFLIPVAVVVIMLLSRSDKPIDYRASPSHSQNVLIERRAPPRNTSTYSAPTTITLTEAENEHPPFAPPPRREQPLVLIADDSLVVRTKLSRLLAGAGFRTLDASDGQQAYDLLQAGHIPSVLITDMEMPSMDGFELIAAVHGDIETEHVPIIAITANDTLQGRVTDMTGVYGFFKKPWNDRDLIRRVRALAAVSEAQATAAAH